MAAVVVAGFLVVGSPPEARLRRLDGRRVADLRDVQSAVNLYWTRNKNDAGLHRGGAEGGIAVRTASGPGDRGGVRVPDDRRRVVRTVRGRLTGRPRTRSGSTMIRSGRTRPAGSASR